MRSEQSDVDWPLGRTLERLELMLAPERVERHRRPVSGRRLSGLALEYASL